MEGMKRKNPLDSVKLEGDYKLTELCTVKPKFLLKLQEKLKNRNKNRNKNKNKLNET